MDISTLGTENFKFLKLPLSEYEFIVFSRTQLDECLVEVKIEPATQTKAPVINLKKKKNEQ